MGVYNMPNFNKIYNKVFSEDNSELIEKSKEDLKGFDNENTFRNITNKFEKVLEVSKNGYDFLYGMYESTDKDKRGNFDFKRYFMPVMIVSKDGKYIKTEVLAEPKFDRWNNSPIEEHDLEKYVDDNIINKRSESYKNNELLSELNNKIMSDSGNDDYVSIEYNEYAGNWGSGGYIYDLYKNLGDEYCNSFGNDLYEKPDRCYFEKSNPKCGLYKIGNKWRGTIPIKYLDEFKKVTGQDDIYDRLKNRLKDAGIDPDTGKHTKTDFEIRRDFQKKYPDKNINIYHSEIITKNGKSLLKERTTFRSDDYFDKYNIYDLDSGEFLGEIENQTEYYIRKRYNNDPNYVYRKISEEKDKLNQSLDKMFKKKDELDKQIEQESKSSKDKPKFVDVQVKTEADLIKLGENLGKACHGDNYDEAIMKDVVAHSKDVVGEDLNARAAWLKGVYRGAFHEFSSFSRIYRRTFADWGSRYGGRGESENKIKDKMRDTQEDVILRQDIIKNKKKEDLNKIFQSKKRTINAAKDENFLNQLKDTFTDGKKYVDQLKDLKNKYELDIQNAKEEDLKTMAKMQRSLNVNKAFMTALGSNMDEPGKSAFNALIEFISSLKSDKIDEIANNYDDETEYSKDNPLVKEAAEAYSELDEEKKKDLEKDAPKSVKEESKKIEKKEVKKSESKSSEEKKSSTSTPSKDKPEIIEAQYYIIDTDKNKIVSGPFKTKEEASKAASSKKDGHFRVNKGNTVKGKLSSGTITTFSRIYRRVFSEVDPKLKEEIAKILKKTGALGTLKSHDNLDDCSFLIEDDGDAYKISVANQGSFVKQVIKELENLFPGHKVSRDYDIMETIFWVEKSKSFSRIFNKTFGKYVELHGDKGYAIKLSDKEWNNYKSQLMKLGFKEFTKNDYLSYPDVGKNALVFRNNIMEVLFTNYSEIDDIDERIYSAEVGFDEEDYVNAYWIKDPGLVNIKKLISCKSMNEAMNKVDLHVY